MQNSILKRLLTFHLIIKQMLSLPSCLECTTLQISLEGIFVDRGTRGIFNHFVINLIYMWKSNLNTLGIWTSKLKEKGLSYKISFEMVNIWCENEIFKCIFMSQAFNCIPKRQSWLLHRPFYVCLDTDHCTLDTGYLSPYSLAFSVDPRELCVIN